MHLPLNPVLKRGAIFIWHKYEKLDDPALAGQTKAKFAVILSGSSLDDPLIFLLTTSEKPKHLQAKFPEDLFNVAAGTYNFFQQNTIIDVSAAGELDVDRDAFETLYDDGEVAYKGALSEADVEKLVHKIVACPRVNRKFKRLLTG